MCTCLPGAVAGVDHGNQGIQGGRVSAGPGVKDRINNSISNSGGQNVEQVRASLQIHFTHKRVHPV